ncbi:Hypothetical protein POVR1_LOCUS145 [uncultured virus]|nr:Hypothetical protein POVR1_LOCUS145 [uncultured virus]
MFSRKHISDERPRRTSKVYATQKIKKIYKEEDLPDPPEVDHPKKRKYPRSSASQRKKQRVGRVPSTNEMPDQSKEMGNPSPQPFEIKEINRDCEDSNQPPMDRDEPINSLLKAANSGTICSVASKTPNEFSTISQTSIQTIGQPFKCQNVSNEDLLNQSILRLKHRLAERKLTQRTSQSINHELRNLPKKISPKSDISLASASITKPTDVLIMKEIITKVSNPLPAYDCTLPSRKADMWIYKLPKKLEHVMIGDVIMYCAKNKIGLKVKSHQPTREKITIEIICLNRLCDFVQSSQVETRICSVKSNVIQFLRGWFQHEDSAVKNFTIANGLSFDVKTTRYYRTKNAIF